MLLDGETAAALPRARRRRRTREDVTQRICDAARRLFGERGYAATTTREIARLADVSETLLFRYYGDKATLFNEVVTAPFHQLMDNFVQRGPDATVDSERAAARRFTRDVFTLFEGNETMFRALLASAPPGDGETAPSLGGLAPFFGQSVAHVQARYDQAGETPPFDLGIGVRLGFGMIMAAVLMRDSLFPGCAPDRDALADALAQIVQRSLMGPASD